MQEDTKQDPGRLPAVSTEAPRPIEVGDYVRLDVSGPQFVGSWQEGTIESLDEDGYAMVRLSNAGPDMRSEIGNVRRLWVRSLHRIPCPAAAQATCSPDPVTPTPTIPNIYADGLDLGGLTPIRCWMHWRDNHADLEHGSAPRWPMTADQIASAKRVWHRLRSEQHAAELGRKVAASAAADRTRAPSVVVELQDEP